MPIKSCRGICTNSSYQLPRCPWILLAPIEFHASLNPAHACSCRTVDCISDEYPRIGAPTTFRDRIGSETIGSPAAAQIHNGAKRDAGVDA